MDKNEIKKDLYKSKEMARLSHYDGDKGALMYHVRIGGKLHEFPIYVTEKGERVFEIDKYEQAFEAPIQTTLKLENVPQLANDLKGAKFFVEIKGSDLNRWIGKALDSGDLVALEA